jgi:predicted transposase/invertase (TIGR01784 family)
MRRDSIFYRLFQQSPFLLFDLLPTPPLNAAYRFESVGVKEPKFEIDGVFLPPDPAGVVYFCEVQFQRDERLYERLFGETFYFYRNRDRFCDWQSVIIYPSQSIEQTDHHPYRALLESDQVNRIYLDQLGEIDQQPLGVSLMLLTTLSTEQAPAAARSLLSRSQQESLPEIARSIRELVTTIIVYKFTALSRTEVEAMLGLRLEETRVYQEAKAEGEQIGRAEGEQIGRAEGVQIGELRGRQAEAVNLVLRQLTRRLKQTLPPAISTQVSRLSLPQLEALSEALLDFQQLSELQAWLQLLPLQPPPQPEQPHATPDN